MVSSQFPSVSVRGRSSVSAISFKKEVGTFRSSLKNLKSSSVGHSTFTQQLGSQLFFFYETSCFTVKILSHCVAPFLFCIRRWCEQGNKWIQNLAYSRRRRLILLVHVREFESSMIIFIFRLQKKFVL